MFECFEYIQTCLNNVYFLHIQKPFEFCNGLNPIQAFFNDLNIIQIFWNGLNIIQTCLNGLSSIQTFLERRDM